MNPLQNSEREKPDKCLGRGIRAKFRAYEKKTEREKPDKCLGRGIRAKFRAHKNERGMSDGCLDRDNHAKFRTKRKGVLLILFASLLWCYCFPNSELFDVLDSFMVNG